MSAPRSAVVVVAVDDDDTSSTSTKCGVAPHSASQLRRIPARDMVPAGPCAAGGQQRLLTAARSLLPTKCCRFNDFFGELLSFPYVAPPICASCPYVIASDPVNCLHITLAFGYPEPPYQENGHKPAKSPTTVDLPISLTDFFPRHRPLRIPLMGLLIGH